MSDSQRNTIAFLENRRAGEDARRIETHISLVFLAGDRAFKLKRAVKLPYADFSTTALRLACCEKEVALNRRTAPDLYLGVRRITREPDGSLALDGAGETVDAVVEMRRFDQEALFDWLAEKGALDAALMEDTAVIIAAFHEKAETVHAGGGAANLEGVLDINRAGFATSHVFAGEEVEALDRAFRAALSRHAALLDAREAQGLVKLCHGDLHLRNIYLAAEGPRLFDCIDFNDQIASVDVLYDLAFLLMDLWHRGLPGLANVVANRYLDRTGDDGGFVLLPFLMAIRAEVRAHVTATQAERAEQGAEALKSLARAYFDLAKGLLAGQRPLLVALGGFSGSGKSTLAETLAPRLGPPPGARILESDRIRKAMHGAGIRERLAPEAYRPEVSQKVYSALDDKAAAILAGGGLVVVNAVFDRAGDRDRIDALAAVLGVPFSGFWLEADAETLKARVASRAQGASDATVDVLDMQLARDIGPLAWRRLDASRPPQAIADEILESSGLQPASR